MNNSIAGQNTAFSTNKTLNLRGRLLDLKQPRVMGILNVTPDSFYAGSRTQTEKAVLEKASQMLSEGATFLDIGGYSSRPGATAVSVEEELTRVLPVIQSLTKTFPDAILSIDTFRTEVARQAVHEGVSIINDISAGELDPDMFDTVAELKVPYIAMHMRGTPQTMKELTNYENLLKEVALYFGEKINQLHSRGVHDILIDPGFGFAKTIDQNFQLLHHLEYFQSLGKPVVVGLSRKSMIWKTLNTTPEEALHGTTTLHTLALLKGTSILRVHDVKTAMDCLSLLSALPNNSTR